jgi:HK97 family phage major capsid protein
MSDFNTIKNLLEQQGRQFEEFKAANDERLQQIEKRGAPDGALVTRVEQLNAAITDTQAQLRDVEAAANRPALGGTAGDPAVAAHRTAFSAFMRSGNEDNLVDLAIRAAVQTGVPADGGHAVPQELDRAIILKLQSVSPMRGLAAQITVGAGYKKLANLRGATSGWVGEVAARTATDTPTLADVTPPQGEIYANPQATQRSLDDVFFNVEEWLANEVGAEFAEKEGVAFVSGDGANKPKGFLTYTTATTGDATRTHGQIQRVQSGAAGAFVAAPNGGDCLINAVQAMKPALRQGASWLMNALTTGAVRKLKDTDGAYLWRPGVEMGKPNSLLGFAAYEDEAMPDIAANSLSIAFGNWQAGYLITDVMGTRVLRDPYTNKPYVGFYTTKRVGGGVVQDQAIKLVQFAV